MRQKTPEYTYLPVYTICSTDNQNSSIKNLQRSFHLGRKIGMSRCIKKCKIFIINREKSLFGKYGNPSGFFKGVSIQKSIFVIDTALRSDNTGEIKDCFRKCGFPGINMSQYAHCNIGIIHVDNSFASVAAFADAFSDC